MFDKYDLVMGIGVFFASAGLVYNYPEVFFLGLLILFYSIFSKEHHRVISTSARQKEIDKTRIFVGLVMILLAIVIRVELLSLFLYAWGVVIIAEQILNRFA